MAAKTIAKREDTQAVVDPAEVIADARKTNEPVALVTAAVRLAGYDPKHLTDEAREFIRANASLIWTADDAAGKSVASAESALATARRQKFVTDRLLCAFAYGVTEVSKAMTKTQLATEWDLKGKNGKVQLARLTPYVTAGRAYSRANLPDELVAAVRTVADGNDPQKVFKAYGISAPKELTTAQLTEITKSDKVKDKASFEAAIKAAKPSAKREPRPNNGTNKVQHADVAQQIYDLTAKLAEINKAGESIPGGTVKDEPKLSGIENVRALHAVASAYLAKHAPKTKAAAK